MKDWLLRMFYRESEDQKVMRKSIRELLSDFSDEYWREKDVNEQFPQEFWSVLAKGGWFGVAVPEDYGGFGGGMYDAYIVISEIANSAAGYAGANMITLNPGMGAYTLTSFGTAKQKSKYLPALAKGQLKISWGITEPTSGVNTLAIQTFAEEEKGRLVIRGQKIWNTMGHLADLMIVVARTKRLNEVTKKTDGITLFLVDMKENKITTRKIKKIAMRALGSNEVFFDDVKVSQEAILGNINKGWDLLKEILNVERICTASMNLGIAEYILEKAVKYAKERIVFGKPIGQNQGVQFPLADSKAKIEAAKLMIQKAAWLCDQKTDFSVEANIAAYLIAQVGFEAGDRAMQTFGGMAFAVDTDVERHWRDLRLYRSAPIPEQMSLNYFAQHLLKLPRSY